MTLAGATTTNSADDAIVEVAHALNCEVFRGSENDALGRFAKAACEYDADVIVRTIVDWPLIDPEVADHVVDEFFGASSDSASNMLEWTYPLGLAVEVVSRATLETPDREATDPAEREHATLFIYRRSDQFALGSIALPQNLSHLRWTIDTPDNRKLASRILDALYPTNPRFGMRDVLQLPGHRPERLAINGHVRTTGPSNALPPETA